MSIGDRVVHCMGHVGVIVDFDGPFAVWVRFVNGTSRVWLSDLSAA